MNNTDPLEALYQEPTPQQPAARFRSEFRNRLLAELGLSDGIALVTAPARLLTTPRTQETAMTNTTTPIAEAQNTSDVLVPYLCCLDAAAALTFYADVLGATETVRMVGDDGRVGHAEMVVGGAKFYLADEYPEMGVLSPTSLGGSPVNLQLRVGDVDAVYTAAIDRGATGLRAPAQQFYGERTASVSDPFGHRWTFSTPVEVLSNAEMAARSAAEGFTSSFAPDGSEATTGVAQDPGTPGY